MTISAGAWECKSTQEGLMEGGKYVISLKGEVFYGQKGKYW